MKAVKFSCLIFLTFLSFGAFGFNVTTEAKVVYIDEFDVYFTRIELDSPTSCGSKRIFMARTQANYDTYLARALTALVAGRYIRIAEREPGYCNGGHLYGPRIGIK